MADPLIDARLEAELAELYRSPDRHYHGLSHVRALLRLARKHEDALADPEAVIAAIWFHDAVYDCRAADNEKRSAALALVRLSGRAEPERVARIVAMIEATAGHAVPNFKDDAAARDAALFLDMDLAILGAAPREFDRYEAAVRREFRRLPEADWRRGRAAVLRDFLERPRIYHTDLFRDRFEAAARLNIARSLAALEKDGG